MHANTPARGDASQREEEREGSSEADAEIAVPTEASPSTYWTAEPADRWSQPSRLARLIDVGLIVAELAAFYILSVVAVTGKSLPAAERLGYQIGTIGVGLAVGLGLRWFVLRGRTSVRPVLRLVSPWLILGLTVVLVSVGSSAILLKPKDPTTALRIAPAYVLVELDPADVAEIEQQYSQTTAIGRGGMAVREVDGADGSVSFLFVIDSGLSRDGNLDEVARGIVSTAGGERQLDSIAGTPVAVVTATDRTYVTWIESPFLLVTLSADEVTARDVATAVLSVPPR